MLAVDPKILENGCRMMCALSLVSDWRTVMFMGYIGALCVGDPETLRSMALSFGNALVLGLCVNRVEGSRSEQDYDVVQGYVGGRGSGSPRQQKLCCPTGASKHRGDTHMSMGSRAILRVDIGFDIGIMLIMGLSSVLKGSLSSRLTRKIDLSTYEPQKCQDRRALKAGIQTLRKSSSRPP